MLLNHSGKIFLKCSSGWKRKSAATYKIYKKPRRSRLHSLSYCRTQRPGADKHRHHSATHSPHNLEVTHGDEQIIKK